MPAHKMLSFQRPNQGDSQGNVFTVVQHKSPGAIFFVCWLQRNPAAVQLGGGLEHARAKQWLVQQYEENNRPLHCIICGPAVGCHVCQQQTVTVALPLFSNEISMAAASACYICC
eukprot:scaffold483667_cov19-Prasinocladus_malaysianus.AAC.1